MHKLRLYVILWSLSAAIGDGIAFCNMPTVIHSCVARGFFITRPLHVSRDSWPPRRNSNLTDKSSLITLKDIKLIFMRAWYLQTEKEDFEQSAALYEAVLKLDPQAARQMSMMMWAEAWGSQNIHGYPGITNAHTSSKFCHFEKAGLT